MGQQSPYRGPYLGVEGEMKIEKATFTEKEMALIEQVAAQRAVSSEEAAAQLFSEGLERRVRKRTGHGPARNIRRMRKSPSEGK